MPSTRLFANFAPAAIVLALCLGVGPGAAKASEASVQRRDYFFSRYFELTDNGEPSGTVIRERWREVFRTHYGLYDAAGEPIGSANTRIFNLGMIFPWARTLDIANAQGENDYVLRGTWFTIEAALFDLRTAEGAHVARLYIDKKRSGCVANRPNSRRAIMARFFRNQVSDHNHERWDYVTLNNDHLPPHVWPLIASFLADVW